MAHTRGLPRLKTLSFSAVYLGGAAGMQALLEALGRGGAPSLEELELELELVLIKFISTGAEVLVVVVVVSL